MTKLQSYIDRYGSIAGPKLYHAIQSRSALIGANARRRRSIAGLAGRPVQVRRASKPADPTPLLPGVSAVEAGPKA